MGTRKLQKGFALVEVLIVSVIVAILAAVAIPVYSGYVTQQRKDVVKNLAETGAVSANIWYRRNGTAPDSAHLGLFLTEPSNYQIQILGSYVIVQDISVSPPISDTALFR